MDLNPARDATQPHRPAIQPTTCRRGARGYGLESSCRHVTAVTSIGFFCCSCLGMGCTATECASPSGELAECNPDCAAKEEAVSPIPEATTRTRISRDQSGGDGNRSRSRSHSDNESDSDITAGRKTNCGQDGGAGYVHRQKGAGTDGGVSTERCTTAANDG